MILPPKFRHRTLTDSKQLSATQRAEVFEDLMNRGDLWWAVSNAENDEIDRQPRQKRKRFAAEAMPLSGKTAGDAYHAKGVGARTDREVFDMDNLRRRHQRGRHNIRFSGKSYGKDA